MQIILRARGTGRTQELTRLCAEAEARGEVSYIVCSNHEEAGRIFREAQSLELPIALPITFYEFITNHYAGHNIKNFFIDNADQLLQYMTSVSIQAVTMEQTEEEDETTT